MIVDEWAWRGSRIDELEREVLLCTLLLAARPPAVTRCATCAPGIADVARVVVATLRAEGLVADGRVGANVTEPTKPSARVNSPKGITPSFLPIKEYAARVGYCRRTIETFIVDGLAIRN